MRDLKEYVDRTGMNNSIIFAGQRAPESAQADIAAMEIAVQSAVTRALGPQVIRLFP